MQQDIMEANFEREYALREDSFPIRLFDRSAIDPIAYAVLTSKNAEEARSRQDFLTQSEEFQKILGRYKSNTSFVVLLKPVPGWLVDDGVRSTENQAACTLIFKKLLRDLEVPYFELGTECTLLQERVSAILRSAQIETDQKVEEKGVLAQVNLNISKTYRTLTLALRKYFDFQRSSSF
jgi:hypothetical protein